MLFLHFLRLTRTKKSTLGKAVPLGGLSCFRHPEKSMTGKTDFFS
jgi:hypothetical protein